jgi:DNA primase
VEARLRADEWDAMRGFAQRGGFSDEELLASGLVKEREEDSDNPQFLRSLP